MRLFFRSIASLVLLACSGAPEVPSATDEASTATEPQVEVGTEIQVALSIQINPPPSADSDARLFLLGWESVDERTKRPPPNTRPDYLPQDLTEHIEGSSVQLPGFPVKAGLYYFAQYGEGMEPGPQFRSSSPVQPADGSLVLEVTGTVIPSDSPSSQSP